MSTFLHSAAMSLLSRTLQTLLSKYLSDVDVQGIAVPSLTDTASGWGVRLSNVKLRDGIQLYELPGRMRRKQSKSKASRRERNPTARSSDPNEEAMTSDNSAKVVSSSLHPTNTLNDTLETVTEAEHDLVDSEGIDDELLQSQRSAASSIHEKKTKGWFSSWLYSSSVPESTPPDVDDREWDEENSNLHPNAQNTKQPDDSSDPLVGTVLHDNNQSNGDHSTEPSHLAGDDSCSEGSADDDTSENDIDEPPMIMRLGKGGTIGTLDVRLIGKAIHVLVEDADLTIEIVRSGRTDQDDDATQQLDSNAHKGTTGTAAASSAGQQTKKKPPKTTGDRVLAENAIARLCSILPNLFLRDIRVRLIIRDEVEQLDLDDDMHGVQPDDYTSNDTVIELTIELLSVNDGKDFLLNFGGANTEDGQGDDSSSSSLHESGDGMTGDVSGLGSKGSGMEVPNEFLTKRIRTGRGSEGGIVLKIYQWGDDTYDSLDHISSMLWARDSWNASTGLVLLRCSGLDLQAKVFLGTKKEIAISNHGYYAEDFASDEYTMDGLMFGGVDYIVPGPQKPLPEISPMPNLDDDETWANFRAVTFTADAAGIQSCRLASPFHKVAQGFIPRHCKGDHLPCEWCHRCWAKDSATHRPHRLDGSTPLAGLVLHVSCRDPLEVNVDRYNLSVLGVIIGLFTKKKIESENECVVDNGVDDATAVTIPNESQRSSGRHGPLLPSQSLDDSARSNGHKPTRVSSAAKDDKSHNDISSQTSFPAYMQPEKIQILGIHLAEVQFRIHIMRKGGVTEGGRSFSYWDVAGKCVTMDYQSLNATERPFQDLRFDVGHLVVVEFRGADLQQIVSLGVRQRHVDIDDITVETFVTAERNHNRSPWPTTASAIIDIPPPLESLVYADRERHGLQLRFVSVLDSSETCDRSRKDAILRVGAAKVDVQFAIKDDIIEVISEAITTVLGPPKPKSNEPRKRVDSLMLYKLIAEGGRLRMDPLINAHLPKTDVEGEISTSHGFSINLFLDKFQVGYGKVAPPRALDRGLSIHQLARLPDNVRLRVLLFLKDLKPLEAALELPESSNTFLRCRAVNKGIVSRSEKLTRQISAMEANATAGPSSRRQELLHTLALLDDDALEALLVSSERRQRVGRLRSY